MINKYLLYCFIGLISISALYAQQKNLKFDMKYQITNNDFLIVNDFPDHKIGKASGVGSALFSDSSFANVQAYFIYDYISGNGDFTEYYTLTFKDNSTLTIQAKGRSLGSTDESMPLFTAILIVTGGTGTYNGSSGSGSMTGSRKHVIEDGSVVKLSFNISLK